MSSWIEDIFESLYLETFDDDIAIILDIKWQCDHHILNKITRSRGQDSDHRDSDIHRRLKNWNKFHNLLIYFASIGALDLLP